jgi:hypothetical protein
VQKRPERLKPGRGASAYGTTENLALLTERIRSAE